MTVLEEALQLLKEKKELLLEYEQITDSMYTVPVEELEHCMGKRQAIIQKVDLLEERLYKLCEELPPEAKPALQNKCDRESLSLDMGALYDRSIQCRAILKRIQGNADGLKERVEYERDDALHQIENINQSSATVAGRYSSGVQTGLTIQQARGHETKI